MLLFLLLLLLLSPPTSGLSVANFNSAYNRYEDLGKLTVVCRDT